MYNEPSIIINGKILTISQAMAVRVAIESFALDLYRNGLGEDEHGKEMTKLYTNRLAEVCDIMRA